MIALSTGSYEINEGLAFIVTDYTDRVYPLSISTIDGK